LTPHWQRFDGGGVQWSLSGQAPGQSSANQENGQSTGRRAHGRHSVCVTLGPQSVFVLRQGLRRASATIVATVCTLCDFMLIMMGAAGFGIIVIAFPAVAGVAAWGGAAFALAYGWHAFRSMKAKSGAGRVADHARSSLRPTRVFVGALALSLLNPQVYLEMVAAVGAIAIQFPLSERVPFVAGVMLVSPLWFFGLAYGGQRLAPLIARPGVSRALDGSTAAFMWGLGAYIIWLQIGVR
jgi:L-lysine exporter family protein LysE/ArgO